MNNLMTGRTVGAFFKITFLSVSYSHRKKDFLEILANTPFSVGIFLNRISVNLVEQVPFPLSIHLLAIHLSEYIYKQPEFSFCENPFDSLSEIHSCSISVKSYLKPVSEASAGSEQLISPGYYHQWGSEVTAQPRPTPIGAEAAQVEHVC